MANLTVAQAIAQLQALPQDAELVGYDSNEDMNLGEPEFVEKFRDQQGNLWDSVEDAQDQADLADCVSGPYEKAVTGELTKVVAIRF